MIDRVVIDTSVWIDYFIGRDADLQNKINNYIDEDRIIVSDIILAELIQGAKTEKGKRSLLYYFRNAETIYCDHTTWRKAAELSFRLKRKGNTVHLIDCYIGVMALEVKAHIFSKDIHFAVICDYLRLPCTIYKTPV